MSQSEERRLYRQTGVSASSWEDRDTHQLWEETSNHTQNATEFEAALLVTEHFLCAGLLGRFARQLVKPIRFLL